MYTLNVYHQDITTMENDTMETLDLISPEDSQQDKIDIEQYIRVYINIRSKKEDLVKQHEEQVAKLDEKMQLIKEKLLEEFEKTNAESVSTSVGTAYRKVKTTHTTNDWESFYNFVLENKAPDLLQKRIHQGAMKEWLEANPTLVPEGLNTFSNFEITIRRKGKK